jgi:mannose/fructose/N-acetylgalactosamine-specific phosphotransferase system component IID
MIALLYILLITHIIISIYFVLKISKANILTGKQKTLNIIMLLLLPFLWATLIYYLLKKQPGLHEVATKNDSSNNYYESGIAD